MALFSHHCWLTTLYKQVFSENLLILLQPMHLINNPLYNRSLEESDPALWSLDDVKALVNPVPPPPSPRGRVPIFPDPRPAERCMEKLRMMNSQTHDESDMLMYLYDLIEVVMRRVGADRQISVHNTGSHKLKVNGESFSIPFLLGCTVNGLPIFHFLNSSARYEERRELIPDLEHVPQDESSTDAFDVAALIAQAGNQKEWTTGPDGIYKVYRTPFSLLTLD